MMIKYPNFLCACICLALVVGLSVLAGCEKNQEGSPMEELKAPAQSEGDVTMKIESAVFSPGLPIPKSYTGDGADI